MFYFVQDLAKKSEQNALDHEKLEESENNLQQWVSSAQAVLDECASIKGDQAVLTERHEKIKVIDMVMYSFGKEFVCQNVLMAFSTLL